MGRIAHIVRVGAGVVALGASVASAQVDSGKALVGKWEGELGPLVGYRDPDDPKRTLVIESVSQQDGKWVASGRFGVTGKRLARVPIEVGRSGARPSIRFSTVAGSTIRLDLLDERNLGGTFTTPGSGQRDRARPLKLQKVD